MADKQPGPHRERRGGIDGAQRDIAGQKSQQQKAAPGQQSQPPVQQEGNGSAGEDAFAAPEPKHAGKHVAQQAEEAGPVFHNLKGNLLLGPYCTSAPILDSQHTHPDGHNSLKHIGQDDHKGQWAPEGAEKVGQARVAAAMSADIIPQDILGDNNRPVEAAAKVGGDGY